MPQDVAAAVKWVKQNIAARGGDPARVFLFGHSSGCLLAAVLATNPVYLVAVGLSPGDLAGVIPMGCTLAPTEEATAGRSMEVLRERWATRRPDNVYSTLDDWLSADPSRSIGPHVPPVLVLLSERERFFPAILEQGAKFVRRLLEVNRPANLVIVPGGHMDSIGRFGADGDPAVAAVEAFIRDPGHSEELTTWGRRTPSKALVTVGAGVGSDPGLTLA
jgi:acetyl esterase/lipase